jgi:leader peptidase (prepilin peptidase) / N-methyltransferase
VSDRLALPLLGVLYLLLAIPALYDVRAPILIVSISALLASALLALSVIDIASQRLPDAITLPLIVAGPLIAFGMGWDDPLWRFMSAAIGYLALFTVAWVYRWMRGRDGLGLGDAKLFAAAGAWLGMGALPSVLMIGCGAALLAVAIALILRRPVTTTSRLAFGPFLAFGFWMVWLYGPV